MPVGRLGVTPINMLRPILAAAATLLFATPALAAADLDVGIAAPTAVHVYDANAIQIDVANVGNRRAKNVELRVQLPETGTSPSAWVLGELDNIDSRCALSGTELVCALGKIRKNRSKTVSFDLTLPEAAKALEITASASTTSSENNLSNNDDAETPALLNYSTTVADGDQGHNRHCTGSTSLTSFFECELYPSSISSHDVEFHGDGTLSFLPAQPGYTGEWSQSSSDSLSMTYYFNNAVVAEFEGYGSSPGCFEGVTTFATPGYVGIYEVCI